MDADEIAELRPAPVGVRVVPLELRRTDAPLKIEGRVAASRAVAIKAPSSGVVGALDVQLGSPLKAGDLICTIGADAHEQRVLAAEAQRLLLEAQLEERRDALVMARARPEPPERVASFEAKMRAAEHRVAQERVNQRRHELASALVEVRAPFDARVAAVSTAPGASLVAGHALIELVEIDPAVVVLEVPTWVAARCRPGARVAVRADSDLEVREGVVSRWAPTANDGVRRLLVEVPNPDGVLAAGESAVAEIDVGERDAFFAPRAALVSSDKVVSLQLVEHSVARIQRVRVVGGDEREVEVAGKLSPSQLVVLHAERRLEDACEVVIQGDH
ncbi:MAG: efflux RND transporter periplasmic adaptor subunit [Myxococcales bacterium]|nr:efflux RND transporter periplasmic adaptor subunit [Myxococcales bacterium]